jgi:hypothetical protein
MALPTAGRSNAIFNDCIASNARDLPRCEHLHAVVGLAQKRVLEVNQLTLHVDGYNLPMSGGNNLVADREARQQHTLYSARSNSRTI